MRIKKTSPRPATPGSHLEESVLKTIVGYSMKRAFLAINDDYKAHRDDIGLSQREFSALTIIIQNQDMSQSDLARALSVERANVVVLVDRLEEADLITRNKVPTDRRAYALRATLKGRRACDRAFAAIRRHEDEMLAGLNADERATLLDLLHRIIAAAAAK